MEFDCCWWVEDNIWSQAGQGVCEFGDPGTWEVSLVGSSVESGRTKMFVRSYIVVENQEAFVDVYVDESGVRFVVTV